MGLKIDLHCHSFFSGDGVSSPEELVASAKKRGIDGFALTDHNTCEGVEYLTRKGLIRPDGLPVDGLLVIPGVEVTTREGHLLCIGTVLPNLKGRPAAEVCKIVHDRGGLAIAPHPYDFFRAGIRKHVFDKLELDAMEVFNAATTLMCYNSRALRYATARGLPMTAGSDAHDERAIGTAYTILDTEDFSVRGVLAQIVKLKDHPRVERYLTPGDSLRKTWSNWLRLKKFRGNVPRVPGYEETHNKAI
jgi:predicted metal-dependent phosphoesterase TrpH